MRRGRGVAAGLVAGALLGALGPMLNAVAWHSGNDSGNSPLAATGDMLLEERASARWQGGYSFEMTRVTEAGVTASERDSSGGARGVVEVVARGPFCPSWPCEGDHEWRGSFPVPVDPTKARVVMDPLGASGSFDGELLDDATGEPCHFTVGWSFDTADRAEDDISLDGDREEKATVTASSARSRETSDVRVTTDGCWPTDAWIEFGHGTGIVASSLIAQTDVTRAHVCVPIPDRGRRCPLDD